MKNKKRLLAIIVIIVVIIGIVSLYFLFNQENKPTLQEEGRETYEKISSFVQNGNTMDEIEEFIGVNDLANTVIMIGPDSYVRSTPSNQVISSNNLSSYVSLNEEYSTNLENKIKDDFDCKIELVSTKQEIVSYRASIKNYYYAVYLRDMTELQNQLLERAGAEDNEINSFKSKVRAMQILDSKLDQYINEDETLTHIYTYKRDNDDERKNALSSFLIALAGFDYHNDTTNAFDENRDTRISGYIDEAISNGIINANNYL